MGELTHHCIYQGDKKPDLSYAIPIFLYHVDTGKTSIVLSGLVKEQGKIS